MGRAKVKMELIKNEKNRQSTFQKRKNCLKKKALELSTLCNVKTAIIIYGPKSDDEPEIWPSANPDDDDFKELIEKFKNQPIEDKKKRATNLSNFFEDRKNKSETALSKLRKKNNEARYPTWNNLYNDLSEEELRELARAFDAKVEAVKARIELLKPGNNYPVENLLRRSNMELEGAVLHPQPLDDYFDMSLKENQMMLALMDNSKYCTQFGGGLSFAPPLDGGAFSYDPMIGMAENGGMAVNNPAPLMWPTMPQQQQYNGIGGPSSSCQVDEYYYYDQKNEFNY